jgi:DNA-binding MarR family transcriptional regulator
MRPSTEHPLVSLYRRPGFLLRRAHQLSVGIFEDQCKALRLTPPQFGVLHVLAHSEGLDQSALSRALGFDRVTTLHIVRGLERRDLLSKIPSLHDKRKLSLQLTETGQALYRQSHEPSETAFRALIAPLEKKEQVQLIALLTKICAALEPQARAEVRPPRARPLAHTSSRNSLRR